MSKTKTKVTKETVTTEASELSLGDNWSCPCMAGCVRAKKPPGHDTCDRHKSFIKWLADHDKEEKQLQRDLSDKLSSSESDTRYYKKRCEEFSRDSGKYKIMYSETDKELQESIKEKKRLTQNLCGEITTLIENFDNYVFMLDSENFVEKVVNLEEQVCVFKEKDQLRAEKKAKKRAR